MNNLLKRSFLGAVVVAAMTNVSCSPPVEKQQPPPPQATQPLPVATPPPGAPVSPMVPAAPVTRTENGRYKIVVNGDGSEGAILYLLDSKDGGTWIYRPPQQPAFNGFWSDIPRLTYPPETWQQVFQQMVKQAQPQTAPEKSR